MNSNDELKHEFYTLSNYRIDCAKDFLIKNGKNIIWTPDEINSLYYLESSIYSFNLKYDFFPYLNVSNHNFVYDDLLFIKKIISIECGYKFIKINFHLFEILYDKYVRKNPNKIILKEIVYENIWSWYSSDYWIILDYIDLTKDELFDLYFKIDNPANKKRILEILVEKGFDIRNLMFE